ncbi:MAG: hypothetical protein JOZ41_02480 [Chloroflexi bacterium]|nr:hypothetical protein [Chloroflexota bacterium]
MMSVLLPAFPVPLVWATLLYMLPGLLRQPEDRAQRACCSTLFCFALGMTVLIPPITAWLDRLTGVANLARLLGNGLGLVAAWQAQTFMAHLNQPEERVRARVRWAGWLLLLALAVMASLFALAPVKREASDFWRQYRGAPYMPVYRIVFLTYLGGAFAYAAHLARRNARIADSPSLIVGLRLATAGGVFGLIYAVEALLVVSAPFGLGGFLPYANAVGQVFIALAATCTVVGLTMPKWGPRARIPELYGWYRLRRAYRRLYPLWAVLYRAVPAIALLPPRRLWADALATRDLRFRLYRRVVEIRDGFLALRPYVDPTVADRARELCEEAGLPPEEAQAVVEAASLKAALDARRRGERPINAAPSIFGMTGGTDIAGDVAMLERVARCYARSAIVRAAAASNRQDAA